MLTWSSLGTPSRGRVAWVILDGLGAGPAFNHGRFSPSVEASGIGRIESEPFDPERWKSRTHCAGTGEVVTMKNNRKGGTL